MIKKYLNKCSTSLAICSLRSKFNVHSLLLLHCVKQKNNIAPDPNATRKQEGKAGVPDTGDEHYPWLLTDGLSHLLLSPESTVWLALVFLKTFRDYALPSQL